MSNGAISFTLIVTRHCSYALYCTSQCLMSNDNDEQREFQLERERKEEELNQKEIIITTHRHPHLPGSAQMSLARNSNNPLSLSLSQYIS